MLSIKKQADIVKAFAEQNLLKVNLDKLEVLEMRSGSVSYVQPIQIDNEFVTPSEHSNCLGVIWMHNLSPKKSILLNTTKAQRAFFALGSFGITSGNQNPLTASEIFETCIIPICLYGSENWLLTDSLLEVLEDFQAEIGKKILKLPKHHANLSTLIALGWPTMRYRILSRKINFLFKLLHPKHKSISSDVFKALKDQEPGPLVVQQCRFLEQVYATNLTTSLLNNCADVSLQVIKKALLKADQKFIWDQAADHNSLSLLSRDISWVRLWDTARDYGLKAALSMQAVFRLLTAPTYKETSCSHCNSNIPKCSPPAEHLSSHLTHSLEEILTMLKDANEDIFSVGSELRTLKLRCCMC